MPECSTLAEVGGAMSYHVYATCTYDCCLLWHIEEAAWNIVRYYALVGNVNVDDDDDDDDCVVVGDHM